MVAYVTQSIEGVDVTAIYTPYVQTSAASATNSPDNPGPPFKAGTEVVCTDGSIWMFVKGGGGINQYDVVMIDPSTFAAKQILGGVAAESPKMRVGFYQNATALTTSDYAWVMLSGTPTINVLGSCAKNVPLYTTDTSGKLDDGVATGSQYPVRNIVLTTTIGSTASFNTAMASWPAVDPNKGAI